MCTVLLHADSSAIRLVGATGGWKSHAAFGFVFRVSGGIPSCVLWVPFSSNFPFFFLPSRYTCRKQAATHRMEYNETAES
jgi:hypothetical protein